MSYGKHTYDGGRQKSRLPLILILIVLALAAVAFSATALVRALHDKDPLPDVGKKDNPSQEEQNPDAQPPADSADAADRHRIKFFFITRA